MGELIVCVGDKAKYKVTIKCLMAMIDGKTRGLLADLGGAYCLVCNCTVDQESACGRTATVVADFYYMNRSLQTTRALCQAHADE